jgi:putative transcriptional regulator
VSVRVRPLALPYFSWQTSIVTTSEDPSTSSLALHLLCAVPQLADPNFVRSVVLIIDHTPQGAFGLVINHELPTTIGEFAEAVELVWEGPSEQTLRLAGPVEPVRAFLLHDQPDWDPMADAIAPGAYLTSTLEAVRVHSESRFGAEGRFLVFLGYAGWGPGQLEAEMAHGSWLAVPLRDAADAEAGVPVPWLWEAAAAAMWQEALAAIGVDPARLIGAALGTGRVPQA